MKPDECYILEYNHAAKFYFNIYANEVKIDVNTKFKRVKNYKVLSKYEARNYWNSLVKIGYKRYYND